MEPLKVQVSKPDNSRHILIKRDALIGVIFALLAAVGFSAKAILVKLAYHNSVDAVTLLALGLFPLCPSLFRATTPSIERFVQPFNFSVEKSFSEFCQRYASIARPP
jgi:drug/metabolite transporter (DMT)-like permease